MLEFIGGLVVGVAATVAVYHFGIVRAIREEFDDLRSRVEIAESKLRSVRL